jgi:hypothetical protein
LTDSENPEIFAASFAEGAQNVDVVLSVRFITKVQSGAVVSVDDESHEPSAFRGGLLGGSRAATVRERGLFANANGDLV